MFHTGRTMIMMVPGIWNVRIGCEHCELRVEKTRAAAAELSQLYLAMRPSFPPPPFPDFIASLLPSLLLEGSFTLGREGNQCKIYLDETCSKRQVKYLREGFPLDSAYIGWRLCDWLNSHWPAKIFECLTSQNIFDQSKHLWPVNEFVPNFEKKYKISLIFQVEPVSNTKKYPKLS